jgi:hypothetical protein
MESEKPEGGVVKTSGFKNFDEFFPYYMREHSNLTCRRLHGVACAWLCCVYVPDPTVGVQWSAPAFRWAWPCMRWHCRTGACWWRASSRAMRGHGYASRRGRAGGGTGAHTCGVGGGAVMQVGHYFFEVRAPLRTATPPATHPVAPCSRAPRCPVQKNKPATFKYPLWSFMGDFKMVRSMPRLDADAAHAAPLPPSPR